MWQWIRYTITIECHCYLTHDHSVLKCCTFLLLLICRQSSSSVDNRTKCIEFLVSAHETIYSFVEVEILDCCQMINIADASAWQMDESGTWSLLKKRNHAELEFANDSGVYFISHDQRLSPIAILPHLKGKRGYHVMLCL